LFSSVILDTVKQHNANVPVALVIKAGCNQLVWVIQYHLYSDFFVKSRFIMKSIILHFADFY
jgi:hypothetical protein